MPRPVLIMLTGDVPGKIIRRTGNFDAMFLRMADYTDVGAVVRDVAKGEMPDDPDRYSGVIVTGSPAMVTDEEPWSVANGMWLRRAWEAGRPILGVCYGHQLMAQAFGGTADYLPYRMELGTHVVTMHSGVPRHPLLPELPSSFAVNLIHSQTARVLPSGATVLAHNENDPHQIVSYGPNAVSLQFHPEFDGAVTRAYIDLIAGVEQPEGQAAAKGIRLGLPARDTPESAAILRHFVTHCRGRG